jgi:hypothetical protein
MVAGQVKDRQTDSFCARDKPQFRLVPRKWFKIEIESWLGALELVSELETMNQLDLELQQQQQLGGGGIPFKIYFWYDL